MNTDWLYIFSGVMFVFCIICIVLMHYVAPIRGWMGETAVKRHLKKLPSEYGVINNILVRYGDRSVQIDHIVVSRYGVFVLESKYMKGKVYGSYNDKYWIKYSEGRPLELRNPVRQNYGHKKAIGSLCGLSDDSIFSMVIFYGRTDLSNVNTWDKLYTEKILLRISFLKIESDLLKKEFLKYMRR